MLKRSYIALSLFIAGVFLSLQVSATPLMSTDTLKERLGEDKLVILEIQPLPYYQQAHIPGSVHTDYAHWRLTDENGLRSMLPSTMKLEKLIGGLGIANQSEVVVVPIGRGAGDMAAAARIYWTLHVAGLESISILDGGLIAYFNAFGKEALAVGEAQAPEQKQFVAKLRSDEIMDIDKVSAYLEAGNQFVDARSPEEYTGKVAGSPSERPGALPGAINLPYDSLMNATNDGLLSTDKLQARFEKLGIPLSGEQVSYCHTGHRTSLVWFVTHEILGNQDARLYDGSTLEWSATKDRPLETHL